MNLLPLDQRGAWKMDDVTRFIRARRIDSFQKLRLLVFLHQHPGSSWSSQELAEKLYLGDVPLLEGIMTDLRSAGLVDCRGNGCTLHNEPGVRLYLQRLNKMFEDPLARQQILDQVTHRSSFTGYYQEDVNGSY